MFESDPPPRFVPGPGYRLSVLELLLMSMFQHDYSRIEQGDYLVIGTPDRADRRAGRQEQWSPAEALDHAWILEDHLRFEGQGGWGPARLDADVGRPTGNLTDGAELGLHTLARPSTPGGFQGDYQRRAATQSRVVRQLPEGNPLRDIGCSGESTQRPRAAGAGLGR
jgi:hypothetical protein